MHLLPFLAVSLPLCAIVVQAQSGAVNWTTLPFHPPALPLAVKSPYLNTWIHQGSNSAGLNEMWPDRWAIDGTVGWYSSVVVDGAAYRIMGMRPIVDIPIATQTAVEFTATRTSFIFNAGPMQINASFISPIEPKDLVRQSLPFSYYTMSATSLDGSPHQLRMYSDITGEFMTRDLSELATWNSVDDDDHVVLSMQNQMPQKYTEVNDYPQDAVEYYAFRKMVGTTTSWAITDDITNRNRTANMTNLGNQQDNPPRQITDNWPVLGIAVDWESVSSTPDPAVWIVGVMRSPAIQYRSPSAGIQEYFPYFQTQWSDGIAAAKAYLDDFPRAVTVSGALDAQLRDAGNSISAEYADLLALSARQVMGSLDITLSKTSGSEWNFADTKVFMKNMGSLGSDVGNTGGTGTSVNTVDTLYAALPAFLYLNPEIVGHLLSPLLEYQDSSAYTLGYAARNIGSSYPSAIADGITDSHDYRIEETANMLIMTLAYSQRSGNGTFLSRHYTLLRRWAQFLENNTMSPLNEKSADFADTSQVPKSNQTNLMLKGIIGIACMSKIAELAEVSEDQRYFNDMAAAFISQWQTSAIASDNSHINFIAGNTDTNGLIYNLYADQLLQLHLVSDQVYEVATVFYNNAARQAEYGIHLNNQDDRTSVPWMMFSAATVRDFATKQYMINQVHGYAASMQNRTPISGYYSPSTGFAFSSPGAGKNSPAIGGVFALLALNTTIQADIDIPLEGSTIPDGSQLSSSGESTNVGTIAGAVVGGVAGAAILGAVIFLCFRRRRRLHEQEMRDARVEPLNLGLSISSRPNKRESEVLGFSNRASSGYRDGLSPLRDEGGTASSEHDSLQRVLLAKQTVVAGELRYEVDNLRRDLDRIREEHGMSVLRGDAPPEYEGPF